MQIAIESSTVNYCMLCFTVLTVAFGYFSYRIRCKKEDRRTSERRATQYAKIFKENSPMVNNCVHTMLNLLTKLEDGVSSYCRSIVYQKMFDSFSGRMFSPLLNFCGKYFGGSKQRTTPSVYPLGGLCPSGRPYVGCGRQGRTVNEIFDGPCVFTNTGCTDYNFRSARCDKPCVNFSDVPICVSVPKATPFGLSPASCVDTEPTNMFNDCATSNSRFTRNRRNVERDDMTNIPASTTTCDYKTVNNTVSQPSFLANVADNIIKNLPMYVSMYQAFTASAPTNPTTSPLANLLGGTSEFANIAKLANSLMGNTTNASSPCQDQCQTNTECREPVNQSDAQPTTTETAVEAGKTGGINMKNVENFSSLFKDIFANLKVEIEKKATKDIFLNLPALRECYGQSPDFLVDIAKKYNNPNCTDRIDFNDMTVDGALPVTTDLAKELNIDVFSLKSIDDIKFEAPNQKVSDVACLLYFITVGPQKFREVFTVCTPGCPETASDPKESVVSNNDAASVEENNQTVNKESAVADVVVV